MKLSVLPFVLFVFLGLSLHSKANEPGFPLDEDKDPEEMAFGEVKDSRDGRTYKTLSVHDKIWMAENLNYNAGNGSLCYSEQQKNCSKYGRLYTWPAANKACPKGWHLPTDEEWQQLVDFIGATAGTKLKSEDGWNEDGNGSNISGFSALPGGNRSPDGYFLNKGSYAFWWTSTIYEGDAAWYRYLIYDYTNVYKLIGNSGNAFSVRCVQDVSE